VSLIQYLLDKGADPNMIRSSAAGELSDRCDDSGGTTLDQFVTKRKYHFSQYYSSRGMNIFKKLEAAGAEFSKPMVLATWQHPHFRCREFVRQVQQFTIFQDQIDRRFCGDIRHLGCTNC
jgi:hypothetical protein